MVSPVLLSAVLSCCFFGVSNRILLDQNLCGELRLDCRCGKSSKPAKWLIPLCPNKDDPMKGYFLYGKFPNAQEYCAEFQNCKRCFPNGGLRCKSCPPGTYGMFCENKCHCKKGSCTREGKCSYRKGHEGLQRCGQPYSGKTPLIKYGNLTEIGQWPWQVAIFKYDENETELKFHCGGSLLNDLWVLTATHCFADSATEYITRKEKFRLFVGKYYRKISKDDEHVQMFKIDKFHFHKRADIALVKLQGKVRMNTRVQPVCLPTLETSKENIVDGKKGVVTGWGRNENHILAETLEQAVLPVVTGKYCKGYQDGGYGLFDVTENMFCAGFLKPFSPDSFFGDSGGPMVFLDPFSDKPRWVIEGIVSWGNPLITKHEANVQLGVYTRVSKYLNWIQSCIKNLNTSVHKNVILSELQGCT